MSYFQNIRLENYRNFNDFKLNFSSGCNVVTGINGSGKTNILEALSLFEKGRGFRKENLKNLVNFNNKLNNFKVSSTFFSNNEEYNIKLSIENKYSNSLKKLTINDDSSGEFKKYFENLFSLIYFLPEMERFFVSNPSVRRNFLDRLVYNVDKKYITLVNSYKKNILERSKILKNYKYDENWINEIEKKIVKLGTDIYNQRINHLNKINIYLEKLRNFNKFSYKIKLFINDDLINKDHKISEEIYNQYVLDLKNNRYLDSILGGCKIGPHKSDISGFNFTDNFNVKHFSTGQQKTLILLIILSQCKFLIEELQIKPIILFDEVCSHLDHANREVLFEIIETLKVQTFLTGTEKSFFSFLSTKASYCNIV